MKRGLCALLAVAFLYGGAACADTPAVGPLASPRPTLKIAVPYTLADMNHDIAGQRMAELTGYSAIYEVMPQDNPTQKLMLEIANGKDYDIVKCSTEQFTTLKEQGALVNLTPYLAAYGDNLHVDDTALAWQAVSDSDGAVYGLPLQNNPTMDFPYGLIRHGFVVRSDVLAELALSLPETLPELETFLRAIQLAKGTSPLTIAGSTSTVWVLPILSAFGLGETEWYDVEGRYVPRVRMPALIDYLAYMQMLYREGLLDAEFPVNKTENTLAKLSRGKAYVTTGYFWDIPTVLEAFRAAGLDTQVRMVGTLRRSADQPATYYVDQGISHVFCIPKSSRHIADAMHYINLQSAPETFLLTYLGIEGQQYEVIDGQYFPLFPGFDDYINAAQFTGVSPDGNEFPLWQARARKLPEMADAYDSMNGKIDQLELHPGVSSYAIGQPGTEKRSELNAQVADMLILAIVSGQDPAQAVAEMIAQWEARGGLDYERAMQTWYDAHKDQPEFMR